MTLLVLLSGGFTVALGLVHFFLPLLLDFEHAIPREGTPLTPLRLAGITYETQRADVRGIAWVMNMAVSFALVSIGALDLAFPYWATEPWAGGLMLWIAAWWFLRAGSQLFLGARRGDLLVLTWFAALGALHAVAAWGTF